MVGTVRKNRTELPPELLVTKDRAPQSSAFAFTDTTTVVSYCPKKGKNVVLMSTLHRDVEISSGEDQKPTIICDYNATKGGVDNLDKVTDAYSTKRMTARWPLVIFYNIIDVSAYNAFVIWSEICPEWNAGKLFKRRMFLEELGKALVVPHIEQRKSMPRTPTAAATVREIQDSASTSTPVREVSAGSKRKRKRCQICKPAVDVKTSSTCVKCGKFICTKHTVMACPSCAK
ncbi:uncharacterized protein LOC132864778 [Neoarius graeffei]|uniref:uncharacterized protein LOC132864778 n=1 Tax=Neoarius graeffei TaxID=443677 RepID=UPI00298C3DC3|nr:uncharacterized protein LOC132864778 [Neoarius graeffei]